MIILGMLIAAKIFLYIGTNENQVPGVKCSRLNAKRCIFGYFMDIFGYFHDKYDV